MYASPHLHTSGLSVVAVHLFLLANNAISNCNTNLKVLKCDFWLIECNACIALDVWDAYILLLICAKRANFRIFGEASPFQAWHA
jgi:hypothetical protein